MKNPNQTARDNFLKKQKLSSFPTILLVLVLVGIPLLMALRFFSEIGVTTLVCEKVELTQVRCEVNQSKYLGLIQQPPSYLTQVKLAKFDYQNSQNSSGESTVDYFVELVNANEQEFVVFQDLIFVNDVRGDAGEMEAIAQEINRFINNPTESSLIISRDLRWRWVNLVPLSIVLVFFGVGIFFVISHFY